VGRLVALGIALSLAWPAGADAQIASAPPPDGLYEAWSPLTMAPVAPLAAEPRALPAWIEVRTEAGTTTVTFLPERRVVWRLAWGPHGPARKTIEVDGHAFATSHYEYDGQGHLARKVVDGPGISGAPWVFAYVTDARGRIVSRTTTLATATPAARWRGATGPASEVQSIARLGGRTVVTTTVGGTDVRRDTYDRGDRLSRTEWLAGGRRHRLELRYRRDGSGVVVSVDRTIAARRAPADARARDPRITSDDLMPLLAAPIERGEALLLLGAPVTSSDEHRGAARRVTDDYADGCWMNSPSALEYDAAGMMIGVHTRCICGLCVDAELTIDVDPASVDAVDLHFTRGPWIRLDGAIDVTADHRVLTPRGPIPAGELRAGDEVLDADGSARVLASVEPLGETELRLGRNVRTVSGTFAAGGILFESEQPRACPP
jgi:hypothetical protein